MGDGQDEFNLNANIGYLLTLLVIKSINWPYVVHGSKIRVSSDMRSISTISDYQSLISGYSFCILIVRIFEFNKLVIIFYTTSSNWFSLCKLFHFDSNFSETISQGTTINKKVLLFRLWLDTEPANHYRNKITIAVSQADWGVVYLLYIFHSKLFSGMSENVVTYVELW